MMETINVVTMSDTVTAESLQHELRDLSLSHNSTPTRVPSLPFRKRQIPSSTPTPAPKQAKMTTVRRLSDEDVKTVFQCLHNNLAPPPKLNFRIVAVGPSGLKLSPPSFEFEEGLYVLLKPQRKKDRAPDYSMVPPHLTRYISEAPTKQECPWSLSGPQFPAPTAIQQRYCYPKGNPEYASKKGGALWTVFGADGKEDFEFRLLHVYYSAKRAVNKGVEVSGGAVSDDSLSPLAKRAKRARWPAKPRVQRTPKRSSRRSNFQRLATASPATSSSTIGSCQSPTSVDTLPLPSHFNNPQKQVNIVPPPRDPRSCQFSDDKSMPHPNNNNNNLSSFDGSDCDDAIYSRTIHPVASNEMSSIYGDFSAPYAPNFGSYSSMPYGDGRMPSLREESSIPQQNSRHFGFPLYSHHQVNHSMVIHTSDHDLQNTYFNEPFLQFSSSPSMNYFDATTSTSSDSNAIESFANHLGTLHKRLKSMICAAPSGDQAAMVSSLISWAQNVVKEPLGGN